MTEEENATLLRRRRVSETQSNTEKEEQEELCPICRAEGDEDNPLETFQCGGPHGMHRDCLLHWLNRGNISTPHCLICQKTMRRVHRPSRFRYFLTHFLTSCMRDIFFGQRLVHQAIRFYIVFAVIIWGWYQCMCFLADTLSVDHTPNLFADPTLLAAGVILFEIRLLGMHLGAICIFICTRGPFRQALKTLFLQPRSVKKPVDIIHGKPPHMREMTWERITHTTGPVERELENGVSSTVLESFFAEHDCHSPLVDRSGTSLAEATCHGSPHCWFHNELEQEMYDGVANWDEHHEREEREDVLTEEEKYFEQLAYRTHAHIGLRHIGSYETKNEGYIRDLIAMAREFANAYVFGTKKTVSLHLGLLLNQFYQKYAPVEVMDGQTIFPNGLPASKSFLCSPQWQRSVHCQIRRAHAMYAWDGSPPPVVTKNNNLSDALKVIQEWLYHPDTQDTLWRRSSYDHSDDMAHWRWKEMSKELSATEDECNLHSHEKNYTRHRMREWFVKNILWERWWELNDNNQGTGNPQLTTRPRDWNEWIEWPFERIYIVKCLLWTCVRVTFSLLCWGTLLSSIYCWEVKNSPCFPHTSPLSLLVVRRSVVFPHTWQKGLLAIWATYMDSSLAAWHPEKSFLAATTLGMYLLVRFYEWPDMSVYVFSHIWVALGAFIYGMSPFNGYFHIIYKRVFQPREGSKPFREILCRALVDHYCVLGFLFVRFLVLGISGGLGRTIPYLEFTVVIGFLFTMISPPGVQWHPSLTWTVLYSAWKNENYVISWIEPSNYPLGATTFLSDLDPICSFAVICGLPWCLFAIWRTWVKDRDRGTLSAYLCGKDSPRRRPISIYTGNICSIVLSLDSFPSMVCKWWLEEPYKETPKVVLVVVNLEQWDLYLVVAFDVRLRLGEVLLDEFLLHRCLLRLFSPFLCCWLSEETSAMVAYPNQ